jgi:tetratricopeptide (TPR) repeat protein
MARIEDYHGNHKQALWNSQKCVEIGKASSSHTLVASALNTMGNKYILLKMYDKVYEVLSESLEVCKKYDIKYIIPNTLGYLGEYYNAMNDYDKALECYEETLTHNLKEIHLDKYYYIYALMGKNYLDSDNLPLAEERLKESFNYYITQNTNNYIISLIAGNLCRLYQKQMNYEKAEENINLALEYGLKQGLKHHTLWLYSLQHSLYEKQEMYREAMEALKFYKRVVEETEIEDVKRNFDFIQFKIDLENK